MRLDRALVARGLARSRTQATRLVVEGRVRVAGALAQKPAMNVDASTEISADTEKWVSRAAHKLLGAIADSGTSLHGRVLDAVVEAAGVLGWGCDWRGPSRLPGAGGNQEFFIRLCSVHGAYYP